MRVVGRYCPVCGAEGMTLYLGGYVGTLYRCPKCDYVGPVVIERELPVPEESKNSDAMTNDSEE